MKCLQFYLTARSNGAAILLTWLLLASTSPTANSITPTAPAGLVAAYSFDEGMGTTVADASGNGNNGTINGAAWTSAGQYGNALVFDGTSALVTVKDSASLHHTTAMTLEAWVYPTAPISFWKDIIYKGNDNYYLMAGSYPSGFPAMGGIFDANNVATKGTANLAANAWTHLAGTCDGTTIRLYVNGVQVSSLPQTGSILTSANDLTIGGGIVGGSQNFQGMIDEVRVYNVALTAAQIQSDMTTPIGNAPPDTPTDLIALAMSSSQINLSWMASTGNAGVAAYVLERSQGLGSTSFTQVAAPTGTNYSDTGLAAATTYNYRVRATDAAGNPSGYSIVVSATTPATPGGLVAAYSFDEGMGTTVADASGNGNDGTINGATWTSAGQYGNALVFDGTSALVTISDSASLHLTTGMTLEAWVYPTAPITFWKDIVYKGNDNYFLMAGSYPSGSPAIAGIFEGNNVAAKGTANLAANTWTHLAGTYDGTTIRLYVNGVQVSSLPQTGSILTSANDLTIGGDAFFGTSQYFQGMIDEVRVYNVALSAAQIQSDMTTLIGNAPPVSPPPMAPSTPNGVMASADSKSQITVRWNASTGSDGSGVKGYRIFRNGVLIHAAVTTTTSFSDAGLASGTQYCYTVDAFDYQYHRSSLSPQACATTPTIDTVDPSIPTGVVAVATSDTEVTVQWNASTDTGGLVKGYRVFRNGVYIHLTASTSFSDAGLAPNTQYCYTVDAFDYQYNRSLASEPACATTLASSGAPPAVPSNLTVIAVTTDTVTLRWEDNSDDELGFLIEQAPSADGPWSVAWTTGADETSYTDTGLAPSTTYYYRVSAFN